jgi:hypothetical protein
MVQDYKVSLCNNNPSTSGCAEPLWVSATAPCTHLTYPTYCPRHHNSLPAPNSDPCTSKECGANATCSVAAGVAVCTCMPGFTGNASIACYPISPGENREGRATHKATQHQ